MKLKYMDIVDLCLVPVYKLRSELSIKHVDIQSLSLILIVDVTFCSASCHPDLPTVRDCNLEL